MKKILLCSLVGLLLIGCGDHKDSAKTKGENYLASSEAQASFKASISSDVASTSEVVDSSNLDNTDTSNTPYEICVQKGIAYYKEIGSYPRLTSQDISAEDKAADSCSRSLVAFDKF